MANPLLKRLLGEAAEDPVEYHLSTVGAGIPPKGRSYPEMPPPRLGGGEPAEEKREVQIAKRILSALDNMNVASTSGGLAADIRKAAEELLQMHGQP